MYRKIPETNTLSLSEEKPNRSLNLFSCRFHTLAYWLTFNSEILTLLSLDKHTNDYDFMIEVYILAPPYPLSKVYLKVHDLYFVKYMCFLKYVHMCLTSPIQKKKKMNVNVTRVLFLPNTLAIFSKHIFQTLL